MARDIFAILQGLPQPCYWAISGNTFGSGFDIAIKEFDSAIKTSFTFVLTPASLDEYYKNTLVEVIE
jgi:hypothetical protein